MSKLCQYAWRNLIVSGGGYNTRDERMTIMNTLVQDYGHKLAGLDRLDVHPLIDFILIDSDLPTWNPLEVCEIQDFVPKLQSARLPLRLLPGLRHILSAVTDLEIGIPADDSSLTMSVIDICEFLKPHSSTLLTLILLDRARDSRWLRWSRSERGPVPFPTTSGHGCRVSFPRLRRLDLEGLSECIAVDVLRTLDCPTLSDFAIITGYYIPNGDLGNSCISTSFLHQMDPSLECIYIQLRDYSVRFMITFLYLLHLTDREMSTPEHRDCAIL